MGAILPPGEYLDIKVSSQRKAGSVKSKQILKRQTAKVGNAEAKTPSETPALPPVAAASSSSWPRPEPRLYLTQGLSQLCRQEGLSRSPGGRAFPGSLGKALYFLERRVRREQSPGLRCESVNPVFIRLPLTLSHRLVFLPDWASTGFSAVCSLLLPPHPANGGRYGARLSWGRPSLEKAESARPVRTVSTPPLPVTWLRDRTLPTACLPAPPIHAPSLVPPPDDPRCPSLRVTGTSLPQTRFVD